MKNSFKLIIICLFFKFCGTETIAQSGFELSKSIVSAKPLEKLYFDNTENKNLLVLDGKGKGYAKSNHEKRFEFFVSGSLGNHSVVEITKNGSQKTLQNFRVTAETNIDDKGYYKQMFDMFVKGSVAQDEVHQTTWNGKTYRFFVPWGLDHNHTMKGLKYLKNYGAEFAELCKNAQRADGMIYSFIEHMGNTDYFKTRDKYSGYTVKQGDKVFVRQPTENHNEYIYVNTIYQAWKSGGDDVWMKNMLTSAVKALDYSVSDPARWSKRFQLLKRVYTIDSWDFAAEDEYLPNLGITNSMILDPVKSKFGIFFGDNTGYMAACDELSEMFEKVGDKINSQKYKQRGLDIKARLDKLSWNGKFFTHFVEEDSTVKRKFGVDEKAQIAQSNAYSLNRPIDGNQKKAIIETYLDLKTKLPNGSPGEFYAIYPPFQSGFGGHGDLWQYMNGGVGGHVAGELAKGAIANGYEKYGVDLLNRLFELGKKYDNKVYFAYTGAFDPNIPKPTYKPLDISSLANMDFWVKESSLSKSWMNSKKEGDDLRNLPTGEQNFADINFNVIDPEKNNRKAVLAVSKQKDFPESIEIPINEKAASIYLLHTASKPASEDVVGTFTFKYEDGSEKTQYLLAEKHLTYWWFSQLKTATSGIAWYGKSPIAEGVGLSWCAIDNPEPTKKIAKIILGAPENKGIYTVFGVTLADKPHYIPVKGPSFGGPDNWASSTALSGMIEGLSGITDSPKTEAFSSPLISPQWLESKSDTVNITIKYPASDGYVSYVFQHNRIQKSIKLNVAASGNSLNFHLKLPENISKPKQLILNGKVQDYTISKIENSYYADFKLIGTGAKEIVLEY